MERGDERNGVKSDTVRFFFSSFQIRDGPPSFSFSSIGIPVPDTGRSDRLIPLEFHLPSDVGPELARSGCPSLHTIMLFCRNRVRAGTCGNPPMFKVDSKASIPPSGMLEFA